MFFKRLILWSFLILLSWKTSAQSAYPVVSFDYKDVALEGVIKDLEQRYQLYFSYSSSLMPMHFGVTASTDATPLPLALETLFERVPVRHAIIGGQVALRADPGKEIKQLERPLSSVRQTSPIYQEPRPTPPAVDPIDVHEPKRITGGDAWISEDLDAELLSSIASAVKEHEQSLEDQAYDETHRLAQISILPYLGTNTHRSHEITNNYSLNILWGTSKAIDGFEFGGIANSVTEDVSGTQIAGAVNIVGQNVTGTQFAGALNQVGGKVNGAQISLGGNIVQDSVTGVQIGGLFNHTGNSVEGNQIAGIFNRADGDVRHQYSLLYNRANDVTKRQIGFINVCDTSYKAPIGFLSIVRRGYNRFELGSSDGLYAQMSGKFGARKFYNIFFLGAKWDNISTEQQNGTFISWGAGYGFGAAPRLGKKILLNTELIGIHINEYENWTSTLNMLVQARLTLDWQVGRHLSFYAGPVLNVMWSELYDVETDIYGSSFAPDKPLWDKQNGKTNWKGWIGFTAGIRL